LAEPKSLTVALPTYNGARHLAEALRGILAQEGADFDLVVSDDRSDDETLAVVGAEAGDRARVEVNSERLGLAGNWNRCVALARTPWVAIFHQDDVMYPGHLASHRAALAAAAAPGLVCGAADVIDAEGREVPAAVVGRGDLGPADRTFPPGGFVAELAVGNPVRCSAVTLRKAAHADVGGFDPSYRYVVDWDFWLRVSRRWARGLEGPADGGHPLASGQRDPPLPARHGRPGRDRPSPGRPVRGRWPAPPRSPPPPPRRRPEAGPRLPESVLRGPARQAIPAWRDPACGGPSGSGRGSSDDPARPEADDASGAVGPRAGPRGPSAGATGRRHP
jgi:hypothetical protein